MDTRYNNEMDANMFNQYMFKSNDVNNLDVTTSQFSNNNNGQQQQSVNQTYHEMNDQTFHTPSFGDEEFDIPVMHHQPSQLQHHSLDQYQHLHNSPMGMMNEQQSYNQHQWHHQQPTAESHMMTNQTYQLQSPSHSNYHHMSSPNQQMLLMQPPTLQPPQQQQSLQPQLPPQMSVGGNNYMGQSPTQTPNGSTSDDSDDPNSAFKRPSPDPFADGDSPKGSGGKKAKPPAKKSAKKKKDPNEPNKPVSAYALFFRDTQAAIKGQNPNASFGEVSKIVASMWDVLAPEHKEVYKKKTEEAKKDYVKALAVYRAGSVSQSVEDSQSPPLQAVISPSQANTLMQQQIPPAVSSHQMQGSFQNSYQQSFVNQSMINQNIMQPQSNVMFVAPNNHMNQQLHQMNQQQQQAPLQINNNNQLPPVLGNNSMADQGAQNCIRIGCTNAAIVSNDWEDEYCSNECVITHCRDVFGNWVLSQSGAQQQQSFPAVN